MRGNRIADDQGAVTVVFAITLTALILFAAVAVDVGYLFDVRRQLQSAADAGALAGCWEYIGSGDIGAADSVARQYVAANQVRPATNIIIDAVNIDTAQGSVQVEVHQDTDNFFARILAPSTLVNAKARARRWRLSGGRFLVPWALPIIDKVDRVEAEIAGTGIIVDLGPTGDPAVWENTNIPVPGTSGGYDVLVRVYNDYGIIEKLIDSQGSLNAETPVSRLTVLGATPTITQISMSSDFVAPDGPSPAWPLVTVLTATPQTRMWLDVNKGKYAMSPADGTGTLWSYQFTGAEVPFEADLLRTYPIDVYAGNKDGTDAYLHIRRSTLPVADVETAPMVVSPGGAFGVRLTLSDFQPATAVPGQIYTMRVGSSGNEAGNFGELNFSQIVHQATCPTDTITTNGNNYYEWTAYGYPGSVHVGDVVAMSPGGTGANTLKALEERFANMPTEAWIVNVPIVEKYDEKLGGTYDVIVEKFAAFRIIPNAQGKPADVHGNVAGEFISYVTNPGGYEEDPGSGNDNGLYAPRLVNPL